MTYNFPNKLRNLAIVFMCLGFLGLTYGFLSAPSSIKESKAMVSASHNDGHGDSHDNSHEDLDEKTSNNKAESNHANHDLEHDEHVFHQLSNKPWAALYVSAFFFFMISLGVLAFYAIQRAAQAGWSPVLYRVMEGITAYLLPGGLIVLVILILSSLHMNHLFIWMDPEVVSHDKLIAGKT